LESTKLFLRTIMKKVTDCPAFGSRLTAFISTPQTR
jgi:hypothetical protein